MTTEIYNFGKAPHPLDIPGELLAEACEIGTLTIVEFDSGEWHCHIASRGGMRPIIGQGIAGKMTEALSAAIAKARESVK